MPPREAGLLEVEFVVVRTVGVMAITVFLSPVYPKQRWQTTDLLPPRLKFQVGTCS